MIPRSRQGRFGFLFEKSTQGSIGTQSQSGAGETGTNPGTSGVNGGVDCPPWRLRVDEGGGGDAAPLYLEKKCNTVEKEIDERFRTVEVDYVYVGCSCRSRFCPDCAEGQGVVLRERVRAACKNWKHCQMWTLTIDPELFGNDPQAAFEYCKKKKVIGELVKALRRDKRFTMGDHYFCAVEWQKETEFVHYHLLVESKYIDFDAVCHYWNLNRPKTAPPVEGNRPGFGSVKFTSRNKQLNSVSHAINYATKYLIKYPDHGFPDWVMNYAKRIDRFHASKLFWRQAMTEAEIEALKKPEVLHPVDCTCKKCTHEYEPRSKRRPHVERIEKCKSTGCVLQRKIVTYPGGIVKRYHAYCFSVDEDFVTTTQRLENYEGKRETVLTLDEYAEMKQAGRWSSEFEYDVHFQEQHVLFSNRPAIYEGEFQSGVLYEGNFDDAFLVTEGGF
ncbi:hypothetical protein Pan241w_22190 [Gimesia alba]|uniref:Replication-associated protein ORF2/G2P domain-containing protein n=2 Tax=Gimesia alba TaxID=2527973 RepID=A0A517RE22_9PLAN|nr:hypothetical protein Pan241w_22190 [Gimesia alba]